MDATCYAVGSRNMPAFQELLVSLMAGLGLSQAEVARRVGHKSNGVIWGVIRGQRSLPLTLIEPLANALELTGAARTDFIRKATAAFAPLPIAQMVSELERAEARLEECRRRCPDA